MPEQERPRSAKPLFIATGLCATAVIIGSFLLIAPSSDLPETAANNGTSNTSAPDTSSATVNQTSQQSAELDEAQLLAILQDDSLPVGDLQPLTLWQPVEQDNANSASELRIEAVASDPANLNELEVGRKIDFVIPHTGEELSGEITAQRNTNKGIETYDIELDNGNEYTGGHIVRGKTSTDVSVITNQGNYTVSINNKTGVGQVIDDRDLNIYRQNPDGVRIPTQEPPAPVSPPAQNAS